MGRGNGIGVKKRTEKRRQNSPMTVWAGRSESPAQTVIEVRAHPSCRDGAL